MSTGFGNYHVIRVTLLKGKGKHSHGIFFQTAGLIGFSGLTMPQDPALMAEKVQTQPDEACGGEYQAIIMVLEN